MRKIFIAVAILVVTLVGCSDSSDSSNNNSPTPQPQPPVLQVDNISVIEGNTGTASIKLALTLSDASTQVVKFDYIYQADTAEADLDYIPVAGVVEFSPGETVKKLDVQIVGDDYDEPDEIFTLELSKPVNVILPTSAPVITILDDDDTPGFAVQDSSLIEAGNPVDGNSIVFTVSLSAPSSLETTVNYTTQNGTALDTIDYNSVSGKLVFKAGEVSKDIAVEIFDDAFNETDEQFSITLSTPVNAVVVNQTAAGTILNDDPVPQLQLPILQATEGDAANTILDAVFNLSAASGQTISVNFSLVDGTALVTEDYLPLSDKIVFLEGETTKTVSIEIVSDLFNEDTENFTLSLLNLVNVTAVATGITATITDNDPLPAISVLATNTTEGDTNSVVAEFQVNLSAPSARIVTVNFATTDISGANSAIAGIDYTSTSGTLSFTPGETQKLVPVYVLGDSMDEPNESFRLLLTLPVNSALTDTQKDLSILDNDPIPTINFGRGSQSVSEFAGKVDVFASLSNPSYKDVVAPITLSGTANENVDYVIIGGSSITFTAGNVESKIQIDVKVDAIADGTQFVGVSLMTPTYGSLGALKDYTLNISDNSAWQTGKPFTHERKWLASAVHNNDIYTILGSGTPPYNKVERFNSKNNTWVSMKNAPFSDFIVRAVTVGNFIYVMTGGTPSSTPYLYQYDPVTDVWAKLANPPLCEWMGDPATVNGKIYFSGCKAASGAFPYTFEYNPGTDVWTPKAAMITGRYAAASAVHNGKIYVFGGNYGGTKNEMYDPNPLVNAWVSKAAVPVSLSSWSVARTIGDYIYVINASSAPGSANFYAYNPLNNIWTTLSQPTTPRKYTTGEVLYGQLYVLGGQDNASLSTTLVEIYNPATALSAVLQINPLFVNSPDLQAPGLLDEQYLRDIDDARAGINQ